MQRLSTLILLLFSLASSAQRVGINTTNPLQALDVNGAIRIGNSNSSQAGSIRYNSSRFEGSDGTNWQYLGMPPKSIVLSQSVDTASIKAAGFSVLRQMENWDTVLTTISTNYVGSWNAAFPQDANSITPASPAGSDCVFFNNRLIYYGSDAYLYNYDIGLQRWTRLPNISPLGVRNACGVALVGNELFVMGGWSFVVGVGFVIYNTGAKYNLVTNTWSTISNLPVTNCYQLTVVIGTDIYLLNGASTFSSSFVYSKKMYRYSTVSNTWSADLAVAATPSFINQGQGAVWNNKIVYQGSGIAVASYDPVTHNVSIITSGSPSETMQQGLHTVAGDKLYVLGLINDTTNISAVPNTFMQQHFEVDLLTGNRVKLSVCNLSAGDMTCYQYHPATDRIYSVGFGNRSNIFTRTGSQSCDVILRRQGFWYYMKKN